MSRRLVICLILIMLPVVAAADPEPSAANREAKTSTTAPGESDKSVGVTPKREASAIAFVEKHHPELAELLIYLKESLPQEYERAVRDLDRTSNRLAGIQQRDPERYELELKLWQARSQAQLLAARIQMSDSPELRRQLRETLNTEHDWRRKLLARDRDRLAERLKKIERQLQDLDKNQRRTVERQMSELTAPSKKTERAGKATKVKASKPPQKQSTQ